MRRRLGPCAAAGLMTAFAPAEFGPAVLGGEALAIERREPAAGPKKARSAKGSAPRRDQPQDGRPRFGKPPSYTASFAPALYARPYASGPFVPNPLVSSEHRATPETAALTSASPPSPSSYRYAADSSYLLRPTFGRSGIALAYRWRHCMNAGRAPAPRGSALRLGAPDAPVVSRDRGQKIDNALSPSILAVRPGALGSASGPNLQLAEAFQPSGWGSAETHRPCVTVR